MPLRLLVSPHFLISLAAPLSFASESLAGKDILASSTQLDGDIKEVIFALLHKLKDDFLYNFLRFIFKSFVK